MLWHGLGYLTLASQVGLTGWLVRYLWVTGTRPWSWQQPIPVPKTEPLYLSSGSDYVGFV